MKRRKLDIKLTNEQRMDEYLRNLRNMLMETHQSLAIPETASLIGAYAQPPLTWSNSDLEHTNGFYVQLIVHPWSKLSEAVAVQEIVRCMPVFETDLFGAGGRSEDGKSMGDTATRLCLCYGADGKVTQATNSNTYNFLMMTERFTANADLFPASGAKGFKGLVTPLLGISPNELADKLRQKFAYQCESISVSAVPNAMFAREWIRRTIRSRGYMSTLCWEIHQDMQMHQSSPIQYRERSFNTWIQKYWEKRKTEGCSLEHTCECHICREEIDEC